ncbi:hypothetical protein [Leptothoe kymatousa]|nr:hypothetical protein [Leptothoe kymatousa]
MLSTADKFLGSLLGAHLANRNPDFTDPQNVAIALNQVSNQLERSNHPPHPQPNPCQQAAEAQGGIAPSAHYPVRCGVAQLTTAMVSQGWNKEFGSVLRWLLSSHDNHQQRHQAIAAVYQQVTDDALTSDALHSIQALYILGDCLEWFMQSSPDVSRANSRLYEYLQQQCATYPAELINQQMSQLLAYLCDPLPSMDNGDNSLQSGPLSSVMLAAQHCLRYRENLALALSTQPLTPLTPSLVGALLGAWGGPQVLPHPWLLALPSHTMQNLVAEADNLYRAWAGVANNADCFGAFALDF